jgi:hypothetical protein
MRRVQKNPGCLFREIENRTLYNPTNARTTAMPEVIAIDGLQKTLDRLLDVLKKVAISTQTHLDALHKTSLLV